MSADYYISPECDCPHPHGEINLNVTYNLSQMLAEAGFPGHKAMTGAPASEAAPIFARTAERIRANPDHFKQFEAENGWGDTKWALEFLDGMVEALALYPTAVIRTWL